MNTQTPNISSCHDQTLDILSAHEQASNAHRLSTAKIDALENMVHTLEEIERCQKELDSGRYLEATRIYLLIKPSGRIQGHLDSMRATILARLTEGLDVLALDDRSIKVGKLAPILQSLEELGQLTLAMSSIKRQTFKRLVPSLFESRVETDQDSLVLQPQELLDPMDRIEQIGLFVRFFRERVFFGQQALFGRLFLPDLMQKMVEEILVPAIPQQDLKEFDSVKQAIEKFENVCEGLMVENPLREFADNISKHYTKQRRERILKEGRKVMLRRLYDSERVGEYHITQTPQVLSMLISDNAESARDLLDMYRALMPSYHRPQLLAHPASALVFRNDCFWLAQKFQLYADPLRELGKAWQELCMMQRVDTIQTTLDALCGFATSQSTWETTIQRAIHLVLEFSNEIQPVVDSALAQDILGRIVDSVLNRLMGDLQDLTDIGADESHVIAQTLNSLAQLSALDSTGMVSSWHKFWLLKNILEMNMREIMDCFRRGELHMFQKKELENLLCALFADSDLRRMNIEEIKSGQPPVSLTNLEAAQAQVETRSIPHVDKTYSSEQEVTTGSSHVNKLMYNPEQEETTGWDDGDELELPPDDHHETQEGWDEDELDLSLDAKAEGWDNDDLELPPDDEMEGWDDEDLFNDEKNMK
ncbi:unnamed protein product [Rhizopus stolonifer]